MRVTSVLVCLILAGAALGQTWQNGPVSGFRYTRFDGEYFPGTGKVYFLGGRLSPGTTDGSVWSYDPLTQAYADAGVDMRLPISNYDICLLRDDYNLPAGDTWGLYIIGGRLSSGSNADSVQVYYPVSNTVRVVPSDPFPGRLGGIPPAALAAVPFRNKVYVFGGLNATAFTVTADAWLFDPLAAPGSKWAQLRSMSRGRAYRAGVMIDSTLYAFGGDTAYSSNLYAKAECEKFNPLDTAAGWTAVTSMPMVCGETRGFGFDSDEYYEFAGQAIIAGQGIWPAESSNCFIYTAATNAWATFPDLLAARRNHAGCLIPGTRGSNGIPGMWVWGGRYTSDTLVLTSSEYYQLQLTGVSEPGKRLPRGTVSASLVRGTVTLPAAARHGVLLDISGKKVLELSPGANDVSRLATGVYLARHERGDAIEEQRLVLLR